MCCLVTTLLLLGPRFFIVVWWLTDPDRWDRAFSTVLWPLLGLVLMPWTTLMWVVVEPRGVDGFEVFWVALAVITDIFSYAGGGYGNRDRIGTYATR